MEKIEVLLENCKCGTKPEIEFGFSCIGKPKVTIYCKKCGKSVQRIGFDGTNIYDLWREEIKKECPHSTSPNKQKSADYYEGFYDAAHLIMAALKARESGSN